MKRAVVVKALTDQIILARTDRGDLVSLSVSCRKLVPGALLVLDESEAGCVIHSVDGEKCVDACKGRHPVIIIEHKDGVPSAVALADRDGKRHVV